MFCSERIHDYAAKNPDESFQEEYNINNFDLALIKAVEKHPVIYDLKIKRRSQGLFENAWKRISDEMNESVSTCKNRYKNLRVWYTRQKKQAENSHGKSKNQKQFYALAFLDPFITHRNRSKEIPSMSKVDSNEKIIHNVDVVESDNKADVIMNNILQLQADNCHIIKPNTNNEKDLITYLGKIILLRLNEMDDKSAKKCRIKIQTLLIEKDSDVSDSSII